MTTLSNGTNWTATYTVIDAGQVRVSVTSASGYLAPETMATYKAREHYRRNRDMIKGTYRADPVTFG